MSRNGMTSDLPVNFVYTCERFQDKGLCAMQINVRYVAAIERLARAVEQGTPITIPAMALPVGGQ